MITVEQLIEILADMPDKELPIFINGKSIGQITIEYTVDAVNSQSSDISVHIRCTDNIKKISGYYCWEEELYRKIMD